MGGMTARRWVPVGMLLAGAGTWLAGKGQQGPGLALVGAAGGFLAQAGWSALRLAGSRLLEPTRLEESGCGMAALYPRLGSVEGMGL